MHFKDTQEMIQYFYSKPVEPEKYEEKKPESKKKKKDKKDGEVLQAD